MKIKRQILSAIMSAAMGAFFGFVINYLHGKSLDLPTTQQQFAENLGIAGAVSGIIGGFLSIFFPFILLPYIKKISYLKKFSIVQKILDLFSG